MMHGAVSDTSQKTKDSLMWDTQQSAAVSPASAALALHPTPPQVPYPSVQHSLKPSTPGIPLLHVVPAGAGVVGVGVVIDGVVGGGGVIGGMVGVGVVSGDMVGAGVGNVGVVCVRKPPIMFCRKRNAFGRVSESGVWLFAFILVRRIPQDAIFPSQHTKYFPCLSLD